METTLPSSARCSVRAYASNRAWRSGGRTRRRPLPGTRPYSSCLKRWGDGRRGHRASALGRLRREIPLDNHTSIFAALQAQLELKPTPKTSDHLPRYRRCRSSQHRIKTARVTAKGWRNQGSAHACLRVRVASFGLCGYAEAVRKRNEGIRQVSLQGEMRLDESPRAVSK
jgi:hypothetical protein